MTITEFYRVFIGVEASRRGKFILKKTWNKNEMGKWTCRQRNKVRLAIGRSVAMATISDVQFFFFLFHLVFYFLMHHFFLFSFFFPKRMRKFVTVTAGNLLFRFFFLIIFYYYYSYRYLLFSLKPIKTAAGTDSTTAFIDSSAVSIRERSGFYRFIFLKILMTLDSFC